MRRVRDQDWWTSHSIRYAHQNDFCNLPKSSTNDCWDRCGSCSVLHDRTTLFQAFRSPQLAYLVSLLFIGQRNDAVMVSHLIQCEQSAKPLLADVGAPITLCYNVTRCIAFNNIIIIIIIASRDRAKNEDNLRCPWRVTWTSTEVATHVSRKFSTLS